MKKLSIIALPLALGLAACGGNEAANVETLNDTAFEAGNYGDDAFSNDAALDLNASDLTATDPATSDLNTVDLNTSVPVDNLATANTL